MPIILCPGFHDRRLNDRLLTRFPSATLLSLGSMLDISRLDQDPLTLIGFSAGVITAMVNASLWGFDRRFFRPRRLGSASGGRFSHLSS
jgi:hypothetical protein